MSGFNETVIGDDAPVAGYGSSVSRYAKSVNGKDATVSGFGEEPQLCDVHPHPYLDSEGTQSRVKR